MEPIVQLTLDRLNRGITQAQPAVLAELMAVPVVPGHDQEWLQVQAQLPKLAASLRFTYHLGDLSFIVVDSSLNGLWLQLKRGTSWHGSVDADELADLAAKHAA